MNGPPYTESKTDAGAKCLSPHTPFAAVGRHTYQFHVYTKTEDPIGKYTNVRFQVQEEGRIGRVNGHVFEVRLSAKDSTFQLVSCESV